VRAGFTVSPRSKRQIYDVAATVRERFRPLMGDNSWVPIERIYETLHLLIPGFHFEVCDREELGDDHGQTFPEDLLIKIREDVYTGMCNGNGRDRFTAAHELGHLFLHKSAGFARRSLEPGAPLYVNSEWQADNFSSAFLIDEQRLHSCQTLEQVQRTFGVSEPAARARFKK
jgi:Zn-dependent peptidase ImmA (M78 family)